MIAKVVDTVRYSKPGCELLCKQMFHGWFGEGWVYVALDYV